MEYNEFLLPVLTIISFKTSFLSFVNLLLPTIDFEEVSIERCLSFIFVLIIIIIIKTIFSIWQVILPWCCTRNFSLSLSLSVYIYYHHHVTLLACISLTLYHHSLLSAGLLDHCLCLYRDVVDKFLLVGQLLHIRVKVSKGECCLWVYPYFSSSVLYMKKECLISLIDLSFNSINIHLIALAECLTYVIIRPSLSPCSIGWGSRIHRLHLCRGVRPLAQWVS